jgi:transcriptional regulator GlxA family with amidase domain
VYQVASETPRRQVLDVTVVLLEGGYASTAIGPIEVFYSAGLTWNWLHGQRERPRFRVRTASIDGRYVTGLCGLKLQPQYALRDIRHTDIIVLQAPGWDVLAPVTRNPTLIAWLRRWHARGAYVAGICTGVASLAEAGILDGRQATTHWGVADILRERYPKVRWRTDQFLTEDRGIFCSGGIYASLDLSLYLVEKFCGHEVAVQCAKSLLISMPRSRQSGYAVTPLSRPHSDDRIREAEEYLQQHFARGVPIGALAERIGMSPRNLIRRFKDATGRLPGAYVQLLRVTAAREMLEHGGAAIQEICRKIGYEDIAFFRALFKRHTGMTPAEYRDRFARITFERGDLAAGR